MSTIQHSPVSHIDLDELLWLHGYGIEEPKRCEVDVEHYAERHESALVGFGWAVVVCVNILLWCAIYAVAATVWRAVW